MTRTIVFLLASSLLAACGALPPDGDISSDNAIEAPSSDPTAVPDPTPPSTDSLTSGPPPCRPGFKPGPTEYIGTTGVEVTFCEGCGNVYLSAHANLPGSSVWFEDAPTRTGTDIVTGQNATSPMDAGEVIACAASVTTFGHVQHGCTASVDPYGPAIGNALLALQEAKAYGVPRNEWTSMVGVAACESGFNPSVTSPTGNMGLYQFGPGTWSTARADYFGGTYGNPYSAVDNASTAAAYVAHQGFGPWDIETCRGTDYYIQYMEGDTPNIPCYCQTYLDDYGCSSILPPASETCTGPHC
jgi:hypothetical protein